MLDLVCDDVLKRLSQLLNAQSDIELAKALGVASQTVSTWRNRNKIPYEKIVELSISKKISLDFLIFGELGMTKHTQQVDKVLFSEIFALLKSDKSEFRGQSLELLLPEILSLYNNAIECESEAEQKRMLNAQLALLNQMILKKSLSTWEQTKEEEDDIYFQSLADGAIGSITKSLKELQATEDFESAKSFNHLVDLVIGDITSEKITELRESRELRENKEISVILDKFQAFLEISTKERKYEGEFKSTQNFNAPVGQAAARDIVNNGKDDKQ